MTHTQRPAATLTVTPYERRYLQRVRDLMFHSHMVHTHLDWHEADHWLETQPHITRLAWINGRLVGVLAASAPLDATCWMRVAIVHNQADPVRTLTALWDEIAAELRTRAVQTVSLLMIRDWLGRVVPAWGFRYVEDIVTLSRFGAELPPAHRSALTIRSAGPDDLEALVAVDHAAFAPPWQLADGDLRQAYRIAASCTLALLENAAVGYQLSTLYFDGAHLARLAVVPAVQGSGVGGALLNDVIQRFFRRGVYGMTLNTQASNLRSRRLYTRFGFHTNGYDLPYWTATL